MDTISFGSLFDLKHTAAAEFLTVWEKPWEAIAALQSIVLALQEALKNEPDYIFIKDGVLAEKSAVIAPSAYIAAPAVICAEAQLRHGAFLRGNVILGRGAVAGNSVEIKNSLLFDGAQAPHFNYVGDSILGFRAHLGAGAVTSNLKSDHSPVTVRYNGVAAQTGMKKLGALVGDNAEIGCNCVLNPGAVIGRAATVYPLSSVRGGVPENSIYKTQYDIVPKEAR